MYLYQLIFKIAINKFIYFTLIGLVAGLANAGILILFNQHIEELLNNTTAGSTSYYIAVYGGAILVFFVFTKILSTSLVAFSQSMIYNFRLEIIRFVLGAKYEKLEARRDETITSLTKDTDNIADSAIHITQVLTSIITILCCFIYLGVLSLPIFLLTVCVVALGIGVYLINTNKTQNYLKKGRDAESFFIKHLNDILYGFKEIKVSAEKGEEIFESGIKAVANKTRLNYTKGLIGFINSSLIGQMLILIYLAGLLIFIPKYYPEMKSLMINYIFILLYILRPIEVVMGAFPFVSMANFSAKKILDLKADLEQLSDGREKIISTNRISPDKFSLLELNKITYTHRSEENGSFTVGPVDLDIARGDTIFIYGGNGSGKTTLMKTLLGLYIPDSGDLKVNGLTIQKDDYTVFQKLFTPVFSDFYLFEELYGVKHIDYSKASKYLNLFEMEGKVKIENRKFSTIKLSMGQRKRLALIASLLENKPIIVLDEWAADQDPYFRKKFYEEILPFLKSEGKTVIAVTHDDKYYHVADKLYKMEYGGMQEMHASKFLYN